MSYARYGNAARVYPIKPGDSIVLNKPEGYDASFLKDYYSYFDPKARVEPPPDPIEVRA
jgi:hypothetical protein